LGRRHLEHVLRTYANHYNAERPHRALGLAHPKRKTQPRRPTRGSNATICLAASSTNTEPQHERRFETPHGLAELVTAARCAPSRSPAALPSRTIRSRVETVVVKAG